MLIYIVIAIIPYTDGFSKIPELVARAKELGYPALALTDHGTVTGLIDFYEECKKQEIKPILGCECYFTSEILIQDAPTYHLVLLAKNNEGYKNLMKIDSYAHAHFYKKPRIGIEILKECHEGLICTTACIGGPLSSENGIDIYESLENIFGDDMYIEIQPHNFDEQLEYNLRVLRELGDKKIIVTLDSHYVTKDDIKTHKMWLQLGDDSQYYGSDDYYLLSEQDVIQWFDSNQGIVCGKFLDNVQEIVNKCNVEIEFGGQHYPVFSDNPSEYVRNRCNEGYKEKGIQSYPNKNVYIEQVKHELDVLEKLGYMNYFCIIDDMLRWCKTNGIPTGLGRGSVVGSCVSWMMGITQIDPIKFNLVFERFANPERVTPADVDSDVSTPCRDRVINYVKEKYGDVYQIRTVNYIKDKSAVQRAGQALGIPAQEIISQSKSIDTIDEMKKGEWKDLATKFRGHIISYGCHASAVLVAPEDVNNWTAVEKQGDNMVVCHDFHQLEAQGLLKLDILGLETLDVIEQTKHRAGMSMDISEIPIDDKATAELLRSCRTAGCFQIESNVMTSIVRRMNVKNVEDLSQVVALGRPGPLDSGMVEHFLNRRNKIEPVTYEMPELEPILNDTEGVIIYQEQIMQIAQKICGYSLGEADNLRRIIGRKVKDEMKPVIDDMISRGVKQGHTPEQMKHLTDNIVTFAAYGFNHCLSYDTIIYRNKNGNKQLTIEEMYKTMNDNEWSVKNGHHDLHTKYKRNGYGYGWSIIDGNLHRNKIVDIFYSGKNYVYRITTESGKCVKCTSSHKLPTPNGIKRVKDIKCGDFIYVKGNRVKLKYDYTLYGYVINKEKITSIELLGMEDVYDVEMASPSHTLTVNDGIVVSNSHSAAYGMTAWATAWLKAHYPCEFMASLIDSNCKDHEKLQKYVSEALELGIRVAPPQLRHKNCYSDYDENGPYIILGMNCIKGVGNTEIPKDAPTDFLGFMEAHGNLNKTVLSNLVKAGVFDGNRLKMLQYIVWYKDKRKSKGEFKYTENPYNKASMEASVMGITVANDIFDGYDTSMVNNFNTFILQIVSVKKTKTKKGKDMAFVKVRDNREIRDLVIFNDTFKNLQKDNVYIVKTRGTQILDFMEAKIV